MQLVVVIALSVLGGILVKSGIVLRRESPERSWLHVPVVLAAAVCLAAVMGAILWSEHASEWLQAGTLFVLAVTVWAVVTYTRETQRVARGTWRVAEAEERRRTEEYRSLLLVVCSDAVLAFERCAILYKEHKQGKQKGVVRSSLPAFPATCDLNRFASVCAAPKEVLAVVELNWRYFQIQRHMNQAAASQIEWDALVTPQLAVSDKDRARNAKQRRDQEWDTAISFFASYRDRLLIDTHTLVHRLPQAWREGRGEAEKLLQRLADAQEDTSEIHGFPGTASEEPVTEVTEGS